MSFSVFVKHQGKKHEVELDSETVGEIFKLQLYSLTGVEPERQKILVKGGQLKNDTNLAKIGVKPGQTLMMMGTPADGGASLQRPKEEIKFVEDMTEAEAAQQIGAIPAGLQNLGNTCYLNSTLQTLRAVPELQEQLSKYSSSARSYQDLSIFGSSQMGILADLTASLRDLYRHMSETQEDFPPVAFLATLRAVFPQFAEKSKTGNGFAQQDAEEAWSQIIHQIREKLKVQTVISGEPTEISFIDKYMAGEFTCLTKCDEPEAHEEQINSNENFLKLDCHISATTNHLRDGILAGLTQKLEKNSPTLGRDATYTKTSQISRLPKYLTIHFVRFFWKRDAQKKAKIMRKVTFPDELDVIEFCTEELQKTLIPIRDKVREIRKDEEDVERARKRQKRTEVTQIKNEKAEPVESKKTAKGKDKADEDTSMQDIPHKTDADIDAERMAAILDAKKELYSMVNPNLLSDDGANKSGLYELRGIVTHQGASADSGHYTSYVKKQGPLDPKTGIRGEEDGKWWWFNDDKVCEVEADKIKTLAGGGESHSALILLYSAIPLPNAAGIDK